MLTKEYRITLPLSVEEYHVGQLYGVAEMSKRETGGGEGVEVVTNEPFSDQPLFHGAYSSGQYTYKIYYLKKKVPLFIRMLAPEEALQIHEKSWNAYPYSRTVYSNPFMKSNFHLVIESLHVNDAGTTENIHRLPAEQWRSTSVVAIDIVKDPVNPSDYQPDEDPTKVTSHKTGRGPFQGTRWWEKVQPVMTCYKLVTADFRWFGLQARVERYIHDFERRLFLKFHRQVVCWLDQWYGLTLDDIRKLEDDTQEALQKQIESGEVQGTVVT